MQLENPHRKEDAVKLLMLSRSVCCEGNNCVACNALNFRLERLLAESQEEKAFDAMLSAAPLGIRAMESAAHDVLMGRTS